MRKLILALCIPLGVFIGCSLSEERAEPQKAPAMTLSTRAESLEIIDLKKMTVEANLQKTCLEILGIFQEAEQVSILLAQQTKRSEMRDRALHSNFRNLDNSSETLSTKCDKSIRSMYGVYPQLRSIHGRALYFWKNKKFPPLPQTKTPPVMPVGDFFILFYLPCLFATE